MEEKKVGKEKKSLLRKVTRIVFRAVLVIILLIATVALLILTPPVQNFARKKATAWLSNKLNTRVDIGKIYLGFPKKVVLENIYVEDLGKDTLLYGGKLKVDISMMKLLKNEVEISQIQLSDFTAKVKRLLPDTLYNFQFIIDAFASADTAAANPADSSSAMKISVKDVELDRISLVYNDAVTGNDMAVWLGHFDTEIDVFDLDKMKFSVPVTNISGIRAKIYQHKPLVASVEDTSSGNKAMALQLGFDKFNLSDIQLDYGNDVSAFYTHLNLGKLVVDADDINLQKQSITLDKVQLDNTTASIRMGKKETAKDLGKKASQIAGKLKEASPVADTLNVSGAWRVIVKNIELNNNNIAFQNDNEPLLKKGMDYAHLDARGITLHADNFIFSPDSIAASITKGQLTEKSGFQLNTLQTDFLYAHNEAFLHNLLLETPGTTLKRSAAIKYPSLDALKKDIGQMQLDINLDNSKIQVRDILAFAPFLGTQPAFADASATWLVNGNIKGSVSNMNIQQLQLKAFSNTSLNINGTIAGLPNADKLKGNLVIRSFRTSRKDIQLLLPKGTLPANITLPEIINLNGTVAGSMADARANLNMTTTLGGASVNGTIKNATNKQTATYSGTINAKQLNLGVIMQNDSMFGPLTATIVASGKGFDPKTASSNVKAVVNAAVLKGYTYKDVRLNAAIAKQKAVFDLNVNDPNINVKLNGKADLSGKFPAISMDAVIDSIQTRPLHFTPDVLVYRGKISADFSNTDPANLDGEMLVTQSALTIKDQRYILDTISLTSGKTDSGKFIRLRSDAINFALTGQYNLAQLGTVFQRSIQPYYSIAAETKNDTLEAYNFNFNAQVINGPLIKAFVPTLTRLDPVTMDGHFGSTDGWYTNINAPLVIMGTSSIKKFTLNAATGDGAINLKTSVQQFSSGTALIMYATTINAKVADNKIDFLANLKDANSKDKYRLGGLFQQPQTGIYSLSLNPDSLLLNYDKWNIENNNLVKLNNGDINISSFVISRAGQQLSINSVSANANAPLEVKFGNFRIGTITAFAKQDSVLLDGVINGQVLVNNIVNQPTFTSDLTVTNLMVMKDTVGNLAIKVNNTTTNVFDADIVLSGKGNDIVIKGDYTVKPANQSVVDLQMDIRQLQMTSIQAFSMGAINRASGFISGRFDIAGTFDKPDVNGELNFNQTGFSPTMLGSYFTIDKEKIVVNNQGVYFDSFTIVDSAKNELVLDGNAYTSNFMNYKLDLDLTADNFQALNSTKQNSKLFYGQFYFDTDMHISGTELNPKIDGSLTVNENTKFTVVLPTAEPGVADREGIVRFIDMDSVRMDTALVLASADSLNNSSLKGMDISVNIEIKKEAELTLVVDEGNGDFLRMKGTAQLTGGIDPSGKTTLTGSYEIEEGSYELSVNFLKRKFDIQKGSKIIWLGEPTRANVNLTAVYIANTSPLALVESQLENVSNTNIYKQKLPFQVKLILEGELLKPDIKFDLDLPTEGNYNVSASVIDNVDSRLIQLRGEPSELNKQVFALLLLNRFVAENPFASEGGGFNAGSAARQSVSKLLTEQLNSLAADLIAGVDLNFDLASSEDYTTGEKANRTDLNVSLSKQLLNDRLKVTVGSNFELEGPQGSAQKSNNLAGNVAIDYLLSKDGRYLIRAYRKNEYEGELDGYIIETGVSFILTFDYNRFRELFHSIKEKKARKRKEKEEATITDDTRKAGPVNVPFTNQ